MATTMTANRTTAVMAAGAVTTVRAQRAARRRQHRASVYWRRRLAVVLLALGLPVAADAALDLLGGGPLTAAEGPVVRLDAQPVARATYVVRSGDTLWSIARRLQPAGDVRPLVDELAAQRGGRPLQPGERIVLP